MVNATTNKDPSVDFWTEISSAEFGERTNRAYRAVTAFTAALEHWVEGRGVLLGVVTLDRIDLDYGYVVLGRDQRDQFRAIETACSYPSIEKAGAALQSTMREITNSGATTFPQDCLQRPSAFRSRGVINLLADPLQAGNAAGILAR
jgi:hypothetical protein